MVLPFTHQGTRRVVRRISFHFQGKVPQRIHGGIPNSHRYILYLRRTRKQSSAGVDFSSAGCLLDCGPKRQRRELLRRRHCVPTSSRSFSLEVLQRTIHSSSFLHCVGFPWKRFSVLFAFTLQGNRAPCFPTHIGIRVEDPCQDAC